jgi:hypothetical protein
MKWIRIIRASGLIEWQCEHGVGHPDASSIEEMNDREHSKRISRGMKLNEDKNYGWGIHGCDGCCSRDDFPGKKK